MPNGETIPLRSAHTTGRGAGTSPFACRHSTYAAGRVRKLVHTKEMQEKKLSPQQNFFAKAGLSHEKDCRCNMSSSGCRPLNVSITSAFLFFFPEK